MKTLFWLIGLSGLLVAAYAWFGMRPPRILDVAGALLVEWYEGRMLSGAVVGLVWGVLWGVRVGKGPWRLHHRPKESGTSFQRRVAASGLVGLLIAMFLLGPLVVALSAVRTNVVPLAPGDRVVELLFAGKTLGVIAAAVAGTCLAYSIYTRSLRWGGQFAVIPPWGATQ